MGIFQLAFPKYGILRTFKFAGGCWNGRLATIKPTSSSFHLSTRKLYEGGSRIRFTDHPTQPNRNRTFTKSSFSTSNQTKELEEKNSFPFMKQVQECIEQKNYNEAQKLFDENKMNDLDLYFSFLELLSRNSQHELFDHFWKEMFDKFRPIPVKKLQDLFNLVNQSSSIDFSQKIAFENPQQDSILYANFFHRLRFHEKYDMGWELYLKLREELQLDESITLSVLQLFAKQKNETGLKRMKQCIDFAYPMHEPKSISFFYVVLIKTLLGMKKMDELKSLFRYVHRQGLINYQTLRLFWIWRNLDDPSVKVNIRKSIIPKDFYEKWQNLEPENQNELNFLYLIKKTRVNIHFLERCLEEAKQRNFDVARVLAVGMRRLSQNLNYSLKDIQKLEFIIGKFLPEADEAVVMNLFNLYGQLNCIEDILEVKRKYFPQLMKSKHKNRILNSNLLRNLSYVNEEALSQEIFDHLLQQSTPLHYFEINAMAYACATFGWKNELSLLVSKIFNLTVPHQTLCAVRGALNRLNMKDEEELWLEKTRESGFGFSKLKESLPTNSDISI